MLKLAIAGFTAATLLLSLAPGCQEAPSGSPRAVAPPVPTARRTPPPPAPTVQPALAAKVVSRRARPAVATRPKPPARAKPARKSGSREVKWDAPIAWTAADKAEAESNATGKPIMLLVYADW